MNEVLKKLDRDNDGFLSLSELLKLRNNKGEINEAMRDEINKEFASFEKRAEASQKARGIPFSILTYLEEIVKENGKKQSKDVAVVQAKLKMEGFNPGPIDGSYGKRTEAALVNFMSGKADRVVPQPEKDKRDAELASTEAAHTKAKAKAISETQRDTGKLQSSLRGTDYKETQYSDVKKETLYTGDKHKAFKDFLFITPGLTFEQVSYINGRQDMSPGWINAFRVFTTLKQEDLGKNFTSSDWMKKGYREYTGGLGIWFDGDEITDLNMMKDLYLSNPNFRNNVETVLGMDNPIQNIIAYMNDRKQLESAGEKFNYIDFLSDLDGDGKVDENDNRLLSGQKFRDTLRHFSTAKVLSAISEIIGKRVNSIDQLINMLKRDPSLKKQIYDHFEMVEAYGPTSMDRFITNPKKWPENAIEDTKEIENSPEVLAFKKALGKKFNSLYDTELDKIRGNLNKLTDPEERKLAEQGLELAEMSKQGFFESTQLNWKGLLVSFVKDGKGLGLGGELTNGRINTILKENTSGIIDHLGLGLGIGMINGKMQLKSGLGINTAKDIKLRDDLYLSANAGTVFVSSAVSVTAGKVLNTDALKRIGFNEIRGIWKGTFTVALSFGALSSVAFRAGVDRDNQESLKIAAKVFKDFMSKLISVNELSRLDSNGVKEKLKEKLSDNDFVNKYFDGSMKENEKEMLVNHFVAKLRASKFDSKDTETKKQILKTIISYSNTKFDEKMKRNLAEQGWMFKGAGLGVVFAAGFLPFVFFDISIEKNDVDYVDNDSSSIAANIALINGINVNSGEIENLSDFGIKTYQENGLLVMESTVPGKNIFDIEGLNIKYHESAASNIQYKNGKLYLGNVGDITVRPLLAQKKRYNVIIIGSKGTDNTYDLMDNKEQFKAAPLQIIPERTYSDNIGSAKDVELGKIPTISSFIDANDKEFKLVSSKYPKIFRSIHDNYISGNFKGAMDKFVSIIDKDNSFRGRENIKGYLKGLSGMDLQIAIFQIIIGMMGDIGKVDFDKREKGYRDVLAKKGYNPYISEIMAFRNQAKSSYSTSERVSSHTTVGSVATYRPLNDGVMHRDLDPIPGGMHTYKGEMIDMNSASLGLKTKIVEDYINSPANQGYIAHLIKVFGILLSRRDGVTVAFTKNDLKTLLISGEVVVGGKDPIRIDRKFVFFFYGRCSNETMGIDLGNITGLAGGVAFNNGVLTVAGKPVLDTTTLSTMFIAGGGKREEHREEKTDEQDKSKVEDKEKTQDKENTEDKEKTQDKTNSEDKTNTQDKTNSEDKTNTQDKTNSEDKTNSQDKTNSEDKTNSQDKTNSEDKTNTQDKTNSEDKTNTQDKTNSEDKTNTQDKTNSEDKENTQDKLPSEDDNGSKPIVGGGEGATPVPAPTTELGEE